MSFFVLSFERNFFLFLLLFFLDIRVITFQIRFLIGIICWHRVVFSIEASSMTASPSHGQSTDSWESEVCRTSRLIYVFIFNTIDNFCLDDVSQLHHHCRPASCSPCSVSVVDLFMFLFFCNFRENLISILIFLPISFLVIVNCEKHWKLETKLFAPFNYF